MSRPGADAKTDKHPAADGYDVPFSSNAVRVGGWSCCATVVLLLAVALAAPRCWERVDGFQVGDDYRIPYKLGNDYWFYGRAFRDAASKGKTLIVGDSVVWGQYVAKDQTLSHYLNELSGKPTYANTGLDGSHPMALAGLIADYACRPEPQKRVILHFNPLWITSDRHDLQTKKEFRFNHPRLVPQFDLKLACYTAPLAERLGITIGRHVELFQWADHLRMAYLDNDSLANWTIKRPYANPVSAMTEALPICTKGVGKKAQPWTKRSIDRANFAWVCPDTSYQWRAFRQTLDVLRSRRSDVFVVVGPFNEHMLKQDSRKRYAEIKQDVASWLKAANVPHFMPGPLPSETYADASHPIAEGYALLAKWLWDDKAFQEFAK